MNARTAELLALEAKNEPFHHIHGAGKAGYPGFLRTLSEKSVDLDAHPALQVREYIYDMALVMRAADLVVSRAGASTLSELAALGVPEVPVVHLVVLVVLLRQTITGMPPTFATLSFMPAAR